MRIGERLVRPKEMIFILIVSGKQAAIVGLSGKKKQKESDFDADLIGNELDCLKYMTRSSHVING